MQDEVYHVEALPQAGIKVEAPRVEQRFGGPAATAAVAIAHLGGAAAYWGRVGADGPGDDALAALGRHRVDASAVTVVKGGRTRRAVIIVDRNGERCIVTHRKGIPDDAGLAPGFPLDDTAVLLADSRWALGAERTITAARARGIPTVFDADGGPRDDLARIIDKTDHVIFSAEGLKDFAGEMAHEQALRTIASASRVVAVTRGVAGSLWRVDGAASSTSRLSVSPVADTTGCGDVFHGAYALAIGEGRLPLQAARFASATAALKAVNGRGWDGMPDRKTVEALLATG